MIDPTGTAAAVYLLVRTGEELCALPMARVRRVVRRLRTVSLPGGAAELEGLAEYGGEPLPVLDLARLTEAAPGATPAAPMTIIAWAGPEGRREAIGLNVDEALEVVTLDGGRLVAGGDPLIAGEIMFDNRPVRVVALERLGTWTADS